MAKKAKNLYLSEKVLEMLKKIEEKELRNASNTIEFLVTKYYEENIKEPLN